MFACTRARFGRRYFCNGTVARLMAGLGFRGVINRNVDFYKEPLGPSDYDVLVTNPPYSGDHVPRLLAFCAASPKPWLLLVPDYVHGKPYYAPLMRPGQGVCYVWPWRR